MNQIEVTQDLPVRELTPKEQLRADTLYLQGRPAKISYRDNGSAIAPPSRISSKKERSKRRHSLKKKEQK